MKLELPKSLYQWMQAQMSSTSQYGLTGFNQIQFVGPEGYYDLIPVPDEHYFNNDVWKREYQTKWNVVQDYLDTIIKIQEERQNETR